MKTSKKLLTGVVLVLTLMLCLAFGASATEYKEGYYTYTVNDGKAIIVDVDTAISGDVYVPDTLGGYSVKYIGSLSFASCSEMTSIVIPSSVSKIGDMAFKYCEGLASVTIPDGITRIWDETFCGCTNLIDISIPESVENIDNGAFSYCSSLENIRIPDSITSMGNYVFQNCVSLKSITIPGSIENIGQSMFYNCSALESVIISDGVKEIGNSAFANCYELKYITIPDSVKDINSYAFSNCQMLKSIKIPSSVENIGFGAFEYCYWLNELEISEGVKNIETNAFYHCEGLTDIVIPESITKLERDAFAGCIWLKNITMPSSITECVGDPFMGCERVENIYISDLEKWCSINFSDEIAMFSQSKNLYLNGELIVDLVIPETVKEISAYAFAGIGSITSVDISDGVESIGQNTFYRCNNLSTVKVSESLAVIEECAFYNCTSLETMVIPKNVKSIGLNAFGGCGLKTITVDERNNNYSSDEYGVLFNRNKTELILYPVNSLRQFYAIPYGVKKIAEVAFFSSENLIMVTIPEGTTDIGELAFGECENLISVTLPESVTAFPSRAFEYSGLRELIIPKTIKTISEYEFSTLSRLKDIYYQGYEEEWNNISEYFVFCSDDVKVHFIDECISKTDHNTGVMVRYPVGTFNKDVKLVVKTSQLKADFVFKDKYEHYISFDISFEYNGEKVQPNGSVTVKTLFPKDFSWFGTEVYYLDEMGEKTRIPYSSLNFEDISFETDHFSEYAIVDESSIIGDADPTVPDEPTTEPDEPTTDPDEPTTESDEPNEPDTSDCTHMCHKSGFMGFIWKIVQFFWKLFKINPVCECGAAHY